MPWRRPAAALPGTLPCGAADPERHRAGTAPAPASAGPSPAPAPARAPSPEPRSRPVPAPARFPLPPRPAAAGRPVGHRAGPPPQPGAGARGGRDPRGRRRGRSQPCTGTRKEMKTPLTWLVRVKLPPTAPGAGRPRASAEVQLGGGEGRRLNRLLPLLYTTVGD